MDCRHLCQVDAGLPCLVSGTAALAEPAPAVAWWWPSQPASQAAAPLRLGLIPPYLAVTPASQVPVAFPDEALVIHWPHGATVHTSVREVIIVSSPEGCCESEGVALTSGMVVSHCHWRLSSWSLPSLTFQHLVCTLGTWCVGLLSSLVSTWSVSQGLHRGVELWACSVDRIIGVCVCVRAQNLQELSSHLGFPISVLVKYFTFSPNILLIIKITYASSLRTFQEVWNTQKTGDGNNHPTT